MKAFNAYLAFNNFLGPLYREEDGKMEHQPLFWMHFIIRICAYLQILIGMHFSSFAMQSKGKDSLNHKERLCQNQLETFQKDYETSKKSKV